MITKIKLLTASAVLSLLSACGGGSGGGVNVSTPADSITGVNLNPAQAIKSLYTFVGTNSDVTYRYQYTQGNSETIDGQQYQVQNVFRLSADGTSVAYKRYYVSNPFAIYTPLYTFADKIYNNNTYTNKLSLGVIPISAKVGDFGLYETAKTTYCNPFNASCAPLTDVTSSWTLEKLTESIAQFCYGVVGEQRLTTKTCYKIDANNQILN